MNHQQRMRISGGFAVALALLIAPLAAADDVVLVTATKPGAPAVRRTGTIVDYTGLELQLQLPGGRVESIPADRVREVQCTWSAAQRQGDQLAGEGKSEAAIAAYRTAKQEDRRPWVLRRIAAKLVGLYAERGRSDAASEEFLAIVGSDPQTIHFDVIPLPWKTRPLDPAVEAKAQTWLRNEKSAVARLLGASWLLPSADRGVAIQTLQKLADSSDPRVAVLAEQQLWRTKLVTARPEDAKRRQQMFDRLPEALKPAACYPLGETWSRVNDADAAAAAYLQLPILYPQQRGPAADALLAAGRQLEKIERREQAAGLFQEVLTRFPASDAATEAQARLAAATPLKEKSP